MRLVKLLANLGYGSQREIRLILRDERVTDAVSGKALSQDSKTDHADILFDGEKLDPAPGVVLMLHKPAGYTCSTSDPGQIVYQLLPERFIRRNPVIASVGRLDRDSTGLLLMTDDGALLHKITAPRSHLPKRYHVTLARPLTGQETALFASGTLMLRSETTPLAPAELVVTGERSAEITVAEGRYHQIKRMFAATGNHVEALHRSAIGGLALGELPEGQWRILTPDEIARIFE